MNRKERNWKSWITDNGSYKLVALFVTLILWVTILGRGDIVMTKEVALDFILPPNMQILDKVERQVNVKVSGPRMALKKFTQSPVTITLDLSPRGEGPVEATITPKNVEVPFGVKVLSVYPETIKVTLHSVSQ
jgi:YbbR domain-containing protein